MSLRPGPLRRSPWMLGALAAAAFTLAVTRVEDPDAWTHLALGRLMVETRGLPAHEVLVYPSTGLEYHNTEWLFDVVIYLVFRAGGLAGLVLVKAATVALAFWILWKDATLSRGAGADRSLCSLIAAAVLLCCLPMVRHRFVERPDVALMVFLGLTIYALGSWGEVFGDRIIATAIPDRILHHAITLNIRGNSYRLKDKLKAGLVRPTEATE